MTITNNHIAAHAAAGALWFDDNTLASVTTEPAYVEAARREAARLLLAYWAGKSDTGFGPGFDAAMALPYPSAERDAALEAVYAAHARELEAADVDIDDPAAIVAWAQARLTSAYTAEEGNAPDSHIDVAVAADCPCDNPFVNARTVTLSWHGTWTRGRWVSLELRYSRHGGFIGAGFSWDSGTGRESTFLDIKGLMAQLDAASVGYGQQIGNDS